MGMGTKLGKTLWDVDGNGDGDGVGWKKFTGDGGNNLVYHVPRYIR